MNKNKMEIHSLALWFIVAGTLKQNLELLCKQNVFILFKYRRNYVVAQCKDTKTKNFNYV
jgi:hypothetical protein